MHTYCVLGSLYHSLDITTATIPACGDGVTAQSVRTSIAGQGAMIATTLASLGARVTFIGQVGDDSNGKSCIELLRKARIGVQDITIQQQGTTGLLVNTSSGQGSTTICFEGANTAINGMFVRSHAEAIRRCDVLLLQGDVDEETALAAKEIARKGGKSISFNPRLGATYPTSMYSMLDMITPSQAVASQLTGIAVTDDAAAAKAGRWFLTRGVQRVLMPLDDGGLYYVDSQQGLYVGPFSQGPKDCNGELLSAAFAWATGRGDALMDAIYVAQATAALADTCPVADLMQIEMLCNSEILPMRTL